MKERIIEIAKRNKYTIAFLLAVLAYNSFKSSRDLIDPGLYMKTAFVEQVKSCGQYTCRGDVFNPATKEIIKDQEFNFKVRAGEPVMKTCAKIEGKQFTCKDFWERG